MNPTIALHSGDCLEILDKLPANHFDAVITDPPYHLISIVKRFGGKNATAAKQGKDGSFARSSQKFAGKTWDDGDIAFRPEIWVKIARVLKPGGHLVAFNHSRTFHRMAVALEDAGLEYRDTLAWVYATGLPKTHPVANNLKRMAATPEEVAAWDGWGTCLKPCFELIALARKPLSEPSIPAQCLSTGTGALNIAATAIPDLDSAPSNDGDPPATRYPGNLIHDGSPEVLTHFPAQSNGLSAARFFYCAKANASDRRGSEHPTVKPQALMEWLVRLIAPKGARILDPFGGSGATAWAAHAQGVHSDLIEREPEYQADISRGISDLKTRVEPSPSDIAPDALPGQMPLF